MLNNKGNYQMQYYINAREWEVIFEKLRTIKSIHTENELATRTFVEGLWYSKSS